MKVVRLPGLVSRALLLLAWTLALPAWAACSRPIAVPVAPMGLSVVVRGEEISGIFPELFASVGAKIGCEFTFSAVPRARIEAMFEASQADILIATESERRDVFGMFVPMLAVRPTLVSLAGERAPVRTVDELLARTELRVAVIRGFDYGPAYRELCDRLTAQGRLHQETDPYKIARLLDGGMADMTIIPPSIMIAVTQHDPRLAHLTEHLRIEALDELPWRRSGIYLSVSTLTAEDRATIERGFAAARKSGVLWQAFKRRYPAAVLSASTRPL